MGGAISGFAIQNSSVSCTSRELYANAHCGLLPFGKWVDKLRSFRRQKKSAGATQDETLGETTNYSSRDSILNTDFNMLSDDDLDKVGLVPWVAILVVSILAIPCTYFPFNELLEVDSFLFVFAEFMQMMFYFYAKHGEHGYY